MIETLEERLKKFAEYIFDSYCWEDCSEPDGGDIQDKAEELGLLEKRAVNPDENDYGADFLYFPVWEKK